MEPTHVIDVDLAAVWRKARPDKQSPADFRTTLALGDEVHVKEITPDHVELRLKRFRQEKDGTITPVETSGFVVPARMAPKNVVRPIAADDILKVDFVDVQQGDAALIESPKGRIILLDGGDNQLFARYLAGRYTGSSKASPREIDCIVVSHGDADHFAGLADIQQSEQATFSRANAWKRLFIHPQRIYHNGLVKRTERDGSRTRREVEMLGGTTRVGGDVFVTELETNLLEVADAKLNRPFRAWKKTLAAWAERGPIGFRRLQLGDDDAFDFLKDEGIRVEVLGPITQDVNGAPGLRFLGHPPPPPRLGHEPLKFTGTSAAHTINGHSIILRLTYGHVRFLFAGDLNEEAEADLARGHADRLPAEVFKVPHHGSADFSPGFLKAVSPVISVISSGDESARKEYIHPRANLVGALGRASRMGEPLIFVTELVAFFATEGYVSPQFHALKAKGETEVKRPGSQVVNVPKRGSFFSFSRAAYGLVKVRTDGRRLVVYTNSANVQKKELYAFTAPSAGVLTPARVRTV
ncbi:MAG: ComEC/Rec2 family competence protein [Candidatus Rokuibacteriota bacterium]